MGDPPANGGSWDSAGANGETLAPLQEEYQNAKDRLNQQTETFRAFANEGQTMLRIVLVFIGLLLTAVSALGPEIASRTIGSTACAVRFYQLDCMMNLNTVTYISGISLTTSAVAHGMVSGNEARAVASLIRGTDIEHEPENNDEIGYLKDRLDTFRGRIKRNNDYIRYIEQVLAIGKISLVLAIVGLTVVTVTVAIGPVPSHGTLAAVVIYGVLSASWFIYVPKEVRSEDRLKNIRNRGPDEDS